jgi:PAS domain S-box-containing protein
MPQNIELQTPYRLLFESLSEGVLTLSPDGKVFYSNQPFADMAQVPADKLCGWSLYEGVDTSQRDRLEALLAQSLRVKSKAEFTLRNGLEVQFSLGPLQEQATSCLGLIVSDITERKQIESKLREAASLKSQFLANMSHEIRTPMNVILSMSEMLLETGLAADERRYAEMIASGAHSLLAIINDILDFSKVEAGKMELVYADFDLNEMAAAAVEFLSESARQKKLKLTFQSGPFPAMVKGDNLRIRQVLINTVGNAIKFTGQGEVNVTVECTPVSDRSLEVHFEVHDTGIGIADTTLGSLFEPFSQGGGSNTRRSSGTGLGLAISKKLVELMGGSIGCSSKLGEGSTFWFTIPLERAIQTAPVPGPDRPRDAQPSIEIAPRVLVVDDNASNRQVATLLLARLGRQCDSAVSGQDALSNLQSKNYSLVFMDLQMPFMDGLETTQAIRTLEGSSRHTGIIAMTANAMVGDRERCLAAGMDDYLSKPIALKELETILARWLEPVGA